MPALPCNQKVSSTKIMAWAACHAVWWLGHNVNGYWLWTMHKLWNDHLSFVCIGTSTADAIVVTCLYFLFLCAAVANFVYTKYPWYDVLIISLAFRTAAFGVRAAYTVSYKPALGGTFLAFSNAGFGANIATCALVTVTWCAAWSSPSFSAPSSKNSKFAACFMKAASSAFCTMDPAARESWAVA